MSCDLKLQKLSLSNLFNWFPSVHPTVSQPVNEPRTLRQRQLTYELTRGHQASDRTLCQASEREWNVSNSASDLQDCEYLLGVKLYKWPHLSSLRFRTPNICRTILDSTPRTPTPFRSALALQEAKFGSLPLKLMVKKNTLKIACLTTFVAPVVWARLTEGFVFFFFFFAEQPSGAADGQLHQAGADGVCYWATSEEDKTRGTFHSMQPLYIWKNHAEQLYKAQEVLVFICRESRACENSPYFLFEVVVANMGERSGFFSSLFSFVLFCCQSCNTLSIYFRNN